MAMTIEWTPSLVLVSTTSSSITIMLSPPSSPNLFSAGHFVAKYFSKLHQNFCEKVLDGAHYYTYNVLALLLHRIKVLC